MNKSLSPLPTDAALVAVSLQDFDLPPQDDAADGPFADRVDGSGGLADVEVGRIAEAFFEAIERTRDLVRDETCALLQFNAVGFADFNRRKNISMLELSRIERNLRDQRRIPERLRSRLVRELDDLRRALEENRDVLEMNMDAMRRVSSLIADMLMNFESDGTYVPPLNLVRR